MGRGKTIKNKYNLYQHGNWRASADVVVFTTVSNTAFKATSFSGSIKDRFGLVICSSVRVIPETSQYLNSLPGLAEAKNDMEVPESAPLAYELPLDTIPLPSADVSTLYQRRSLTPETRK